MLAAYKIAAVIIWLQYADIYLNLNLTTFCTINNSIFNQFKLALQTHCFLRADSQM